MSVAVEPLSLCVEIQPVRYPTMSDAIALHAESKCLAEPPDSAILGIFARAGGLPPWLEKM